MMELENQDREQTHIFAQGFYTPSGYHFYYQDITLADLLKEPLFLEKSICPNDDMQTLCSWYAPLPTTLYYTFCSLFESKGWTLHPLEWE